MSGTNQRIVAQTGRRVGDVRRGGPAYACLVEFGTSRTRAQVFMLTAAGGGAELQPAPDVLEQHVPPATLA